MSNPTNEEVFEAMSKARMAVTTMRAAMRYAEMECEKSKKMNRLVRDMIELIARFEQDFEDGDKNDTYRATKASH